MNQARWRCAGSMAVYLAASLVLGREVLAHLATRVASDAGDPLLVTIILHWIATHVPYTDAWYQLPIFYPSRDALTFSEHLLGVGVVAAPLQWLTGSALVAFNLVTVFSFALSAAAMYALVWRLTGSAAGAFVAGLAYGFAPYRISQLPHLQMLAVWYAPLALLGLHAYLETRRRRWLALYGVAWLLQAAANGYMLVYFSVLVGLWGLWFVVARRRWREMVMVTLMTLAAVLPLVPILVRYVQVHAYHGMVRDPTEVEIFSADMSAVLCAPYQLSVWSWLRIGCRPEGELFPGMVLMALAVAALVGVVVWEPPVPSLSRARRLAGRLAIAGAVIYACIAASVGLLGTWAVALGPLRASSSSVAKPFAVSLTLLLVAFALSARTWQAVRGASATLFYLAAAFVMWTFSLGPHVRLMGESAGYVGPFIWLMQLPGANSIRVPSRFWIMAVLCLSVAAGLFVAELLRRRSRRFALVAVPLVAFGLLADGWVARIDAVPIPFDAPAPQALRGKTVLELPVDVDRDIAASYRAVIGGWRGVNGYSGYWPDYYGILTDASRQEVDGLLDPLQALGELHVVVANEAGRHIELLRRQPGVMEIARDAHMTQFVLPSEAPRDDARGVRYPIRRLESPCESERLAQAIDGDVSSRWTCGPSVEAQHVTVDLGQAREVGAVMHGLGSSVTEFPRLLTIETSMDGESWMPAWTVDGWGAVLTAAMADHHELRLRFPFLPREARYLRLTHPEQPYNFWAINELEVWSR